MESPTIEQKQNLKTGQSYTPHHNPAESDPRCTGSDVLRTYAPTGRVNKPEDVANRFTYHAPQPDQLPRYTYLRDKAHWLAAGIIAHTPESREQSLALTHLEEAVMWANAAIARNE